MTACLLIVKLITGNLDSLPLPLINLDLEQLAFDEIKTARQSIINFEISYVALLLQHLVKNLYLNMPLKGLLLHVDLPDSQ